MCARFLDGGGIVGKSPAFAMCSAPRRTLLFRLSVTMGRMWQCKTDPPTRRYSGEGPTRAATRGSPRTASPSWSPTSDSRLTRREPERQPARLDCLASPESRGVSPLSGAVSAERQSSLSSACRS